MAMANPRYGGREFRALKVAEKSLSHWGIFVFPNVVVRGRGSDLGQDPLSRDYRSTWEVDGRTVVATVKWDDVERRGAAAREEVDAEMLRTEFDIDPATIEFL